ncbi:MAG: helix-turn-helix domain-containing protein, partial [Thermoleophilaceae bacterium]
ALTPAERRVVDLASKGLANREVAQQLFVTSRTVEMHLSAAYAKLGISSRTELADALERQRDPRPSIQIPSVPPGKQR